MVFGGASLDWVRHSAGNYVIGLKQSRSDDNSMEIYQYNTSGCAAHLWLSKKHVFRYDKLIPYFQYDINYNTTDPCSLSTKLSFCCGSRYK